MAPMIPSPGASVEARATILSQNFGLVVRFDRRSGLQMELGGISLLEDLHMNACCTSGAVRGGGVGCDTSVVVEDLGKAAVS